MFGGLEHEKIMRSIRLMGEEVIPALKTFIHPPAWPSSLAKRHPYLNRAYKLPGRLLHRRTWQRNLIRHAEASPVWHSERHHEPYPTRENSYGPNVADC